MYIECSRCRLTYLCIIRIQTDNRVHQFCESILTFRCLITEAALHLDCMSCLLTISGGHTEDVIRDKTVLKKLFSDLTRKRAFLFKTCNPSDILCNVPPIYKIRGRRCVRRIVNIFFNCTHNLLSFIPRHAFNLINRFDGSLLPLRSFLDPIMFNMEVAGGIVFRSK